MRSRLMNALSGIARAAGCLLIPLLCGNAFADFRITAATLDGGASVTAAPNQSISAALTLEYFGNTNGARGRWTSTLWTVGGVDTCVNHAEQSAPGPDGNVFSISAPAGAGLYDLRFQAFSNSNCGGQNSDPFTLSGSLQVEVATLLARYRLEEDAWAGSAGEVKDSSGNNRHGTAIGTPLPGIDATSPARGGNPGTCDYGTFGGGVTNGPALSLGGLPVDTRPGARTSVAFWMYWDGSNNAMPIGWNVHDLWLVNGFFGFNTGNSDVFGISSSGLANGWHHVVAVFTNGAVAANELYIDGVKQTLSQRMSSPNNSNAYVRGTLQVSGWGANGSYRFSGRIDEVAVYDGKLGQSEVDVLYAATHACPTHPPPQPPTLAAEYRFDDAWSVSTPLADSSGNGRDAVLTGGAVDQSLAPASGLKPETCKAGSFTRSGYFTASGLDLSTAAGAKSTVAFWMYWDGSYPADGWAMPFRWDGQFYDLAFKSNGRFGFNTGQGDVYGFSSAGLANGWHHVVAVFTSGGVGGNKLYLDGQLRTLQSDGGHASRLTSTGAIIGAGGNWSNGYKFRGLIDSLRIYRNELDQANVTALYQQSQPCLNPVAEYRMDETAWNGTLGEVRDSAGAAHATAMGGAGTVAGKLCQAGSFNGASGYVNLPNTSALNFPSGGGYTFSAWVKTSDAYGQIVSFRDQSNDVPVIDLSIGYNGMGGSPGQFVPLVRQDGGGIAYLNRGPAVNDGQWHFVALVYDPTAARILSYVDGAKVGEAAHTRPSALTTAGLRNIGREGRWVQVNFTNQDREYLNGLIDEVKIWNNALSAAQIASGYANEAAGRNWDGSARTCATPPPTGPAALNAVDVGADAISGRIVTKTAGSAFSLDIHALNAARTARDTNAVGEVLVDLLANTGIGVGLDANNCPTSASVLPVGSVTLTAGTATVAIGAVADSWRDVRVRMRYPASGPATVTACSADNFAVKPAALSAIASHADWQTAGFGITLANTGATGGAVHKAGLPFSVRVSGYNAANVITSNYDGTPTASVACLLPASGCVVGLFSPGAYTPSAGTLVSNTATYGEVGAISLTFSDTTYASVDSSDTAASCAGFHVCASAIAVGRFVPDHYDVANLQSPAFQTFGSACANRSFTYLGQNFGFATLPRARITAKNSAGGTTRNARDSLWKLSPNGHFSSAWRCQKQGGASCDDVNISAAGFSAGNLVANGDGSGDFTWPVNILYPNGVKYQFSRSVPPPSPFNAEIGLGIRIQDGSEAGGCGLASCVIRDSQAVGTLTWGDVIAFDAGSAFRQGRLRLANAAGSELLPLPVPLSAQYWNGQGWVTNTQDNCTAIASPPLTLFAQTADNQLAAGETVASFNATLIAGNGNLRFSAPGAGNHGFLDLSVTTPSWLRFDWDGVDQGGDGDLLDDAPRARAAFGKRRGRDKVIIRRELY